LGRTIELDKLLSLDVKVHYKLEILGFAEENNVVFLTTARDVFAVQLHSLQFKRLSKFNGAAEYYPFECVYTVGNSMPLQCELTKQVIFQYLVTECCSITSFGTRLPILSSVISK
jgi:hypothetical protein